MRNTFGECLLARPTHPIARIAKSKPPRCKIPNKLPSRTREVIGHVTLAAANRQRRGCPTKDSVSRDPFRSP